MIILHLTFFLDPHTGSTDQMPNNNPGGVKSSPQHYQTKGVEMTTNDMQEVF